MKKEYYMLSDGTVSYGQPLLMTAERAQERNEGLERRISVRWTRIQNQAPGTVFIETPDGEVESYTE